MGLATLTPHSKQTELVTSHSAHFGFADANLASALVCGSTIMAPRC